MKKARKSLKALKYIGLAILCFLALVSISVFIQTKINPGKVPSIFGFKPFVVLSGSMDPEMHEGDLTITQAIDASLLKEGDIIAFKDEEGHVVTHRIVSISENSKSFTTRGDNNNSNDPESVASENIEGKYLFKISGLGNVVLVMQSPITLCVALLIIFAVGIIWILSDKNKLSAEERKELEKLRKEHKIEDNKPK